MKYPPFAAGALLALTLAAHLLLMPGTALADRLHVVRPGQTLARIAKRYGVGIWDLAMANGMTPRKPLRAGQELMVPPAGVTYVRPGQTLSHIARAHQCSIGELQRINRIRGPLRAGSRLRLPGYEPQVQRRKDWGEAADPGVVTLRDGAERATLRLVDAEGRVMHSGLVKLGDWMQRHPDGATRLPHPRLARLLAHISDHFGGREINLVSGFRAAGGYTKLTSRHVEGRAADIRVQGVSNRQLWELCRSLGHTGCGYYPRSSFVHVDARPHNAQWVDWSRPGKRRRYGTLRRPYRRRQRTDPKRPRVGRSVRHPHAVPLRIEVIDEGGTVLRVADDASRVAQDVLLVGTQRYWPLSSWPPRPL